MVKRAIIENGIVKKILLGGSKGIEVDDTVKVGDIYEDNSFKSKEVDIGSLRNDKKKYIEYHRDLNITKDVHVHGRYWQANSKSITLLNNEITAYNNGLPLTPYWRDSTNNNMVLTDIQQLIDIVNAIKIQTEEAYVISWNLKDQLNAASNIDDIFLIEWPQ